MRDFVPRKLGPGERYQPGLGPTLTLQEQSELYESDQRHDEAMRRFTEDIDARERLRRNRVPAFEFVVAQWGGVVCGYKRWAIPIDSIRVPKGSEEWSSDPRCWAYRNINRLPNPKLVDGGERVEVDLFDVMAWEV